MYRRRRNISNRYGGSGSRFGVRFKVILITVILLAAVCAVITGALLGNRADRSQYESFGRRNLTAYGGVDEPAADYAALGEIRADFVASDGGIKAFKSTDFAEDCNAAVFKANDGAGNIFFTSEALAKNGVSFTPMSNATVTEITEVLADKRKLGVACLYSTAIDETDSAICAMKSAEELALISELASAGVDEIALFGIPDETDKLTFVKPYLAWAKSCCEGTNICVVLDRSDVMGSGATRIISAAQGYADAFAIDLSELTNSELGEMIERCAYFITNYNMRLIVSNGDEAERAEILSLFEAYGIKSYYFINSVTME